MAKKIPLFASPLFKVRRYEVIRLGVTFETEVDFDISGGLHYTWTLFDSAGRVLGLPLIDTHRQTLTLPGHLLHYGTYTATAGWVAGKNSLQEWMFHSWIYGI